jgi:hypothetical protein
MATGSADFINVENDFAINLNNVSYVKLTRRGGANVHFVGTGKVVRLKPREAKPLRAHVSKNRGTVADINAGSNRRVG